MFVLLRGGGLVVWDFLSGVVWIWLVVVWFLFVFVGFVDLVVFVVY